MIAVDYIDAGIIAAIKMKERTKVEFHHLYKWCFSHRCKIDIRIGLHAKRHAQEKSQIAQAIQREREREREREQKEEGKQYVNNISHINCASSWLEEFSCSVVKGFSLIGVVLKIQYPKNLRCEIPLNTERAPPRPVSYTHLTLPTKRIV